MIRQTVLGLVAGVAAVVCVVSAAAVWLGQSLAGCYVEWIALPQRPLCGSGIWGVEWMPVVVLIACILALTVAAGIGIGTLVRQFGKAARFRRRLSAVAQPHLMGQVRAAAEAAGLTDVECVPIDVPMAVTIGVWRPTVIVSTGLADLLTVEELTAVLRHERVHREGRHPVLYGLARTASAAAFPIPALRTAARRVVLAGEITADKAAVDAHGVRSLVGALLKISDYGATPHAVALGSIDGMLEDRLRAMSGDTQELEQPTVDRSRSIAAAAIVSLPLLVVSIAWLRAAGHL